MAKQRPHRVTLPGADELFFRPSGPTAEEADAPVGAVETTQTETAPVSGAQPRNPADTDSAKTHTKSNGTDGAGTRSGGATGTPRTRKKRKNAAPEPSGRQRHDEKITVYVSAQELLALEQARLTLRGEHGVTADRGRIVREAVAVLLADFDERGDASTLVSRLLN